MTETAADIAPTADDKPAWSLGGVFEYNSRITPQRLVLLFVAGNFAFLAWDVFLAHAYTKTWFRVPYEWIPVFTPPLAVLTALVLAFTPKRPRGLVILHLLAMVLMLAVGIVGFAMHLFTAQGLDKTFTWQGIVNAAPVLAPLAFAGVALVGIVAVADEDPTRRGRLRLLGGWLRAPFTQQQHLHLLNGLGLLAATVLAVIDHSHKQENSMIWIPIIGGFLLSGLVLHHAAMARPRRLEKVIYFWAMILAMVIGLVGFSLHLEADLSGTGELNIERLMRLAPPFAPLLFTNMGMLGLLALIEPAEED